MYLIIVYIFNSAPEKSKGLNIKQEKKETGKKGKGVTWSIKRKIITETRTDW